MAVGLVVAGVLLRLAACLLALFGDRPVTGYTLLVLPIAVQELVLAGWLLVKGFDPPAADRPPERRASAEQLETSPG